MPRGSDDRSLSGTRSTVGTPGETLQRSAPGAIATTAHARNGTLQVYPGATLNKTNWHPTDHRSPLQSVYIPILYSPLRRASFSLSRFFQLFIHIYLCRAVIQGRAYEYREDSSSPYIRQILYSRFVIL